VGILSHILSQRQTVSPRSPAIHRCKNARSVDDGAARHMTTDTKIRGRCDPGLDRAEPARRHAHFASNQSARRANRTTSGPGTDRRVSDWCAMPEPDAPAKPGACWRQGLAKRFLEGGEELSRQRPNRRRGIAKASQALYCFFSGWAFFAAASAAFSASASASALPPDSSPRRYTAFAAVGSTSKMLSSTLA
jgi:hypothetical protein